MTTSALAQGCGGDAGAVACGPGTKLENDVCSLDEGQRDTIGDLLKPKVLSVRVASFSLAEEVEHASIALHEPLHVKYALAIESEDTFEAPMGLLLHSADDTKQCVAMAWVHAHGPAAPMETAEVKQDIDDECSILSGEEHVHASLVFDPDAVTKVAGRANVVVTVDANTVGTRTPRAQLMSPFVIPWGDCKTEAGTGHEGTCDTDMKLAPPPGLDVEIDSLRAPSIAVIDIEKPSPYAALTTPPDDVKEFRANIPKTAHLTVTVEGELHGLDEDESHALKPDDVKVAFALRPLIGDGPGGVVVAEDAFL